MDVSQRIVSVGEQAIGTASILREVFWRRLQSANLWIQLLSFGHGDKVDDGRPDRLPKVPCRRCCSVSLCSTSFSRRMREVAKFPGHTVEAPLLLPNQKHPSRDRPVHSPWGNAAWWH